VFAAEAVPAVAESAIGIGARYVRPVGMRIAEAAERALAAGLMVVEEFVLMVRA